MCYTACVVEPRRGDPNDYCIGDGGTRGVARRGLCNPCVRTREANMRCEQCGRPMENAEMWQLGGNPSAPTSRSMRQVCWDCRQPSEAGADPIAKPDGVIAEATEVVKQFETNQL